MDEQSNEAAGGRPKFLSGTTGLIGGVTALVVAMAGLATATKEIWHKEPKPTVALTDDRESQSSSEKTTAPTNPESFTIEGGEGGTLTKIGKTWLWTGADLARYEYVEDSNDGTTTIAIYREEATGKDFYLRWPNAGGAALQSEDGRSWGNPVKLIPKKS